MSTKGASADRLGLVRMGPSRWPLKLLPACLDGSGLSTACACHVKDGLDTPPGTWQWGTYREHAFSCQGLFSRKITHCWWRHSLRPSSSPRRRGSRAVALRVLRPWMPACAGMTAESAGMTAFQFPSPLRKQGSIDLSVLLAPGYGPLLPQGRGLSEAPSEPTRGKAPDGLTRSPGLSNSNLAERGDAGRVGSAVL